MVIVAVLNAGRNSFSFFLLLIVCLGYGVVKPTLGKTMLIVRGLAATHFVFGVIYAVASLSITPDTAGMAFILDVLYGGELLLMMASRAPCSPCHPSTGRNANCVLHLDTERSGQDDKRPSRSETECESPDVPKTHVVYHR